MPKRSLSTLIILSLLLQSSSVVFGQDSIEAVRSSGESLIPTVEEATPVFGENTSGRVLRQGAQTEEQKVQEIETQIRATQPVRATTPVVDHRWETEQAELRARLLEQQQILDQEIEEYTGIGQEIEDYTARLTPLRMQIQTLSGQITLLEQEILINQKKISSVELQIQAMRIEIDELFDEIQDLEERLSLQKNAVLQYMRLLYEHENKYYDFKTGGLDDLKLLLSEEKMASVFRSQRYLTLVQQSIRSLIDQYERTLLQYEWKKEVLFTKQDRLRQLEVELVQTEADLKNQISGKEYLLKATLGQEAKYQVLIAEMRTQEANSLREIQVLQEAITLIQNDVSGSRVNQPSFSVLSDEELRNRAYAIYQLGQGSVTTNSAMFAWPVPPNRGISARFRDPSYTRIFGVPHSAIDVPAPQGTPIQAPADAYVYKVADNGYGYSYIILAHQGDFLTLYGHVSKIMVSPGQTLKRGEVIGLSGGAPGTLGAGWMTTGAHLHFEVFKNGQHVDPLLYLDQSILKTKYTPQTGSYAPTGNFLNPTSTTRSSTPAARPATNTNPLPEKEAQTPSDGDKVKRVQ